MTSFIQFCARAIYAALPCAFARDVKRINRFSGSESTGKPERYETLFVRSQRTLEVFFNFLLGVYILAQSVQYTLLFYEINTNDLFNQGFLIGRKE